MNMSDRGFTLVELLIVIVIISILAAVAVPAYTDHVQRSKIAEATSTLAAYRVRLEQYYQDNANYGSTATTCGVAMPTGAEAKYFSFTCNWGAGGTNQGFLLTATGTAAGGTSGYTFTIDHANAKRTTAFPGASGLPKSCWILRKGDSC